MRIDYHDHTRVGGPDPALQQMVEWRAARLEERCEALSLQPSALEVHVHFDLRDDRYRVSLVLHVDGERLSGDGVGLKRWTALQAADRQLHEALDRYCGAANASAPAAEGRAATAATPQ